MHQAKDHPPAGDQAHKDHNGCHCPAVCATSCGQVHHQSLPHEKHDGKGPHIVQPEHRKTEARHSGNGEKGAETKTRSTAFRENHGRNNKENARQSERAYAGTDSSVLPESGRRTPQVGAEVN
jgi:hypothetical protein